MLISTNYTWDFWYLYDANEMIFHVLFLNADHKYVASGQHHLHSQIGYAKTRDFIEFENISDNVFSATKNGWDNTSIWSGCLIMRGKEICLFYTSRTDGEDDGFTQHIGLAKSVDFLDWERLDNPVSSADEKYYETKTVKGGKSIHAWRDPFVFPSNDGSYYMLIAAQSKIHVNGRNGAIAILKSKKNDITSWKSLPPIYDPGCFAEIELPQAYRTVDSKIDILFNCWAKNDLSSSKKKGGLYSVKTTDILSNVTNNSIKECDNIVNESSGLYGLRPVLERDSTIFGFDTKCGGIISSSIKNKLFFIDDIDS